MKTFFGILVLLILAIFINCTPAQPKSTYEIYSTPVTGATTYHFFLEKKSANSYKLIQNMDYLNPSVLDLEVGTSTTSTFDVSLPNDGSEYTVGVVAENSAGFYSGMGVSTSVVGVVPTVPAGVGLRKK